MRMIVRAVMHSEMEIFDSMPAEFVASASMVAEAAEMCASPISHIVEPIEIAEQIAHRVFGEPGRIFVSDVSFEIIR